MGSCISVSSLIVNEKNEKDEKEIVNEKNEKEDIFDIYKNYVYENTPEFTFNGMREKVKILKIIDGDTVDIALCHSFSDKKVYRHRVRMYGIDTPEKRPLKSNENRDKEIEASKKSTEALRKKMEENDWIVVASFYKNDKYGRLMCTFYDKMGEDINKWMISNGYAKEYFGGTKEKYNEVEKKE